MWQEIIFAEFDVSLYYIYNKFIRKLKLIFLIIFFKRLLDVHINKLILLKY